MVFADMNSPHTNTHTHTCSLSHTHAHTHFTCGLEHHAARLFVRSWHISCVCLPHRSVQQSGLFGSRAKRVAAEEALQAAVADLDTAKTAARTAADAVLLLKVCVRVCMCLHPRGVPLAFVSMTRGVWGLSCVSAGSSAFHTLVELPLPASYPLQ